MFEAIKAGLKALSRWRAWLVLKRLPRAHDGGTLRWR